MPRGGGDASITRSLSSTCFTPLERRAISIARCRSSSDCTLPSRVTTPFVVVTPISVCLSVSSRWYLACTSALTASSVTAPVAFCPAISPRRPSPTTPIAPRHSDAATRDWLTRAHELSKLVSMFLYLEYRNGRRQCNY